MVPAAGINAWPEWRLIGVASSAPTGSATELTVRAPVPRQPDTRDWRAERRDLHATPKARAEHAGGGEAVSPRDLKRPIPHGLPLRESSVESGQDVQFGVVH
jgi:hypothetical protein